MDLPQLATDNTVDITFHASRMGLTFPVRMDTTAYRKHLAKAVSPDRDTFLMLDAAVESIDATLDSTNTKDVELYIPFHFDNHIQGFRAESVRLYVSMHADPANEDTPWLLVSSLPQSSPSPSSGSPPHLSLV